MLEYEMIRNKELADEAYSAYASGKEFAYDHIMREEVIPFKKDTDSRLNIRVNPQRRSLKAILLLFVEPYVGGTRDSEKYINPDLRFSVTINGMPNNSGIKGMDMWEEVSRSFGKTPHKSMNVTKFLTRDEFGFLIDLWSMADNDMHGNRTHLVNTKDGVHLELERNTTCPGNVNCHVITISN